MTSSGPQLRRRRLGVMHIVFFTVAASAPLTVLGGGVTTTYAVSGLTGIPLSFLIIAVALALFAVGYAAMSRFVANAGAFYSYLANGLGPVAAVSGAFVALIAYNGIQIGLYGLFGSALGDLVSSMTGLTLPWWVWGFAALLVVGLLGVRRVDLNANVLAVLLVLECIAVASLRSSAPSGTRRPGSPSTPRSRRRRCSCRAPGWSSRSAWPRSSASSPARSTARRSAIPASRWRAPPSPPSGSPARSTPCRRGRCSSRSGRPTSRSSPRRTDRAWCSRAWPSTGATPSPRSPTCCSLPACSPRC